ncbi:GFA family protein [Acidisoma cellulosilytica]|uniref:GFA family protein n=1 Tax=Acidisoma cellulosilyticum TaxID=2802395 RepID=A0A964E3J5_9PROT|nr:GFA family protein [Acidisoma cellulosilyticum]MCB8880008.1 GFA family protein [Acidisoma cellulosilyticum]
MTTPREPGQLRGRCVCGAVRFTVADAFLYAVNCHCSGCRQVTGSAFKPLAGIGRDQLAFSQGADALMTFGDATGHDTRCARCGSFLFALVQDGAFVHVALGVLEDCPTIRPAAHIFVGSKAPWFTITDDLPQYEGHIPSPEPKEPDHG